MKRNRPRKRGGNNRNGNYSSSTFFHMGKRMLSKRVKRHLRFCAYKKSNVSFFLENSSMEYVENRGDANKHRKYTEQNIKAFPERKDISLRKRVIKYSKISIVIVSL